MESAVSLVLVGVLSRPTAGGDLGDEGFGFKASWKPVLWLEASLTAGVIPVSRRRQSTNLSFIAFGSPMEPFSVIMDVAKKSEEEFSMDTTGSMDPKKFTRILVGVDDSPDAQLAFRYAMNRAKFDDAELVICSVLESDNMNIYQALSKDYVHGQRSDLQAHLQEYEKLARRFGITKVKIIIGEGDPGETIVKKIIPEVEPDLLVVGSLSQSGVRKYFGSQAAYMAKYSPVSVMIVR